MSKSNLKLADAPPSARSQERAELAAAIEQHQQSLTERELTKQAREKLPYTFEATQKLEKAEAAVVEAQKNAGMYLAARLIGEAAVAPPSVREARTAAEDAADELAALRESRALLEQQEKDRDHNVTYDRHKLEARIQDVIKAELPEALLTEWGEVARRFLELQGLLAFAEQRELLPDTFRRWQSLADCTFADEQNRPLAGLRSALAALESDADWPLPSP
jgi:hypothetical protein